MNLRELVTKHGENFKSVVETELRRLATELPDFIYCTDGLGECLYNGPPAEIAGEVRSNPPSKGCIFGQALQALGWDDVVEMAYGGSVSELFMNYASNFIPPFDWRRVQTAQDNGNSWSYAIQKLPSPGQS